MLNNFPPVNIREGLKRLAINKMVIRGEQSFENRSGYGIIETKAYLERIWSASETGDDSVSMHKND